MDGMRGHSNGAAGPRTTRATGRGRPAIRLPGPRAGAPSAESEGLLQGLIAKRAAAATEHALEGPNQKLLRAQKHVWIALCSHYFNDSSELGALASGGRRC